MDKPQDNKKSFCTRCFLPIDGDDKVDIENQSFHRICSTCCVCRKIPTSLKMFCGHIFCNDCFKEHVLSKFKGDDGNASSNSWNQWARTKEQNKMYQDEPKEKEGRGNNSEHPKRGICARCLLSINDGDLVTICNQNFHARCAKCYLCHTVPTKNLKIYYGQLFCEDCFHRHVLNRNHDNPAAFFNNCFDQWQKNAQFAQNMREFMAGNKDATPFIFMMQENSNVPFCRCGNGPHEWFTNSEPKKSVTPAIFSRKSYDTCDYSYESHTDNISYIQESPIDVINDERSGIAEIEKIAKLTKYLRITDETKNNKKWKILEPIEKSIDSDCDSFYGWVDLQKPKTQNLECPKCLWQCGPIYIHDKYLQKFDVKC